MTRRTSKSEFGLNFGSLKVSLQIFYGNIEGYKPSEDTDNCFGIVLGFIDISW